jgi:2,3-bisphosphoglycerate-independent phosphoglycerate mutase
MQYLNIVANIVIFRVISILLLYFCMMIQKVALIILDGWGIGNHSKSDAVFNANTPFTDALTQNYAHATLLTDGENVGLPEGQMGNSEVGHMNIGAGRIVWQMLAKINKAFAENTVKNNQMLNQAFNQAKSLGKNLHFIRLVSDGGVHSHIDHLIGLCKLADEANVPHTYIHAFLDGRDTDPKSGLQYLTKLNAAIERTSVKLSSVVGRYFAMDRDLRWERVKKAYDLMVNGVGEHTSDILETIQHKYSEGITDEFMVPIRTLNDSEGQIQDGDVVVCFNFRTDRGRQITRALSQEDFHNFNLHKLNLHYYTMTVFDETYKIEGSLFENDNLALTLGEVIQNAGVTQLRAAETEKYPHVTFFFSGGRETEFDGEHRIMANSPKVATYDLQPEMSAPELAQRAGAFIQNEKPDFVCLNFANADMVGHTGVYNAIIQAVETVDSCLEKLVEVLKPLGYQMIVIADHGNADFAINNDGTPNTAHTTNPVPVWFISENSNLSIKDGILADVAPTILALMGIEKPAEMTGKNLIS